MSVVPSVFSLFSEISPPKPPCCSRLPRPFGTCSTSGRLYSGPHIPVSCALLFIFPSDDTSVLYGQFGFPFWSKSPCREEYALLFVSGGSFPSPAWPDLFGTGALLFSLQPPYSDSSAWAFRWSWCSGRTVMVPSPVF